VIKEDEMKTGKIEYSLDYRSKKIDDLSGIKTCFCIGPQNGDPVCPCRMRNLQKKDGRWIEIIDHGPVK